MAVDPSTVYPSNVDPPEPDYPWGKARNVITPGDYSGTPWEAAFVNDLFGFFQAILTEAGLTPSGISDTARDSQFLRGLSLMLGRIVDNIAALRAFDDIQYGQVVWLKAHTNAGDGGHGPFRYIDGMAPATYTDDDYDVILPTGGDGSAAFLRIKATPYYTDSGAANAYVLTRPDGGPAVYSENLTVIFKPLAANTGPSTINVGGVGVVALVSSAGAALGGGELVTGRYTKARYTGSSFQLVSSGEAHLAGAETFTGPKTFEDILTVFGGYTSTSDGKVLIAGDENYSSSISLIEYGVSTQLVPYYGFEFKYDGATNKFLFRRYSASTTPSEIFEAPRNTGIINFLVAPTINGEALYHTGNLFNATPAANQTANAITATKTVDTNSTGFGALLLLASDGNYDEADASAASTMPCTALALETGTGSKLICKQGYVRNDSWSWTPGGLLYVDTTTGALTQTAPSGTGEVVQIVGNAETATVIYFNPEYTTIVLS